jgi:hypothetical protein
VEKEMKTTADKTERTIFKVIGAITIVTLISIAAYNLFSIEITDDILRISFLPISQGK